MKKQAVIFIIFLFLVPPLFSLAVIKEISGKVEIKAPQQDWEPAMEGMSISEGTYISTGFNSKALLDLGESVLEIKPLTRMQLEELIKKEGIIKTALYLRVGKVKAELKSVEGLQHDFKLKSPVATAAVRGCEEMFEWDGLTLKVFAGEVVLKNLLGQKRTLAAGEESRTSGYDNPLSAKEGQESRSGVTPYTSAQGGVVRGPETLRAVVTIEWEW